MALLLVAACVADPGDDRPASTTDGAQRADTGVASPAVRVTTSGVRACADPSRRAERRLDLLELPGEPVPDGLFRLWGGGVVVADLDGDGRLDLFLPGRGRTELYEHDVDGALVPTTAARLPAGVDLSLATGASAADVEGDGDLDLLVTRWDLPNVLLVQQDGVFVDGTARAGLRGIARWQSSAWGDLDDDGDLDLFVGAYGPHPDDPHATVDFPVGDPSGLWENRGDGTFVDRADRLPPSVQAAHTFQGAWQDLDDDGRDDLVVVNDFGWARPGTVLWNRPGELVEDDGRAGLSAPFAGMGLGLGDVDGDGRVDLVQSSWRDLGLLLADGRGAWVEAARERGLRPVFEADEGAANPQQVFGWGAELVDLDLDADLDVVVNFGFWDAYGEARAQRDAVFEQDADGTFHDRGAAWGYDDPGAARGLAIGDLNDDGWPDLVERVLDAPTRVLLSRCGAEAWLRVRLAAPPPNTGAVGAQVRVVAGGRSQLRWVRAGGTGMYGASAPDALFGLADADGVELVEITWPDGAVTALHDLAARQVVDVVRLP